jgi:2-oxoglutarate dehydrogenase E2 component (dihydrolipoamide succinyltransferase)
MILEMKVPSPGESISEVEIAEWLVKDGDFVEKDQTIAEVDSDKATLDLPAEESGVITLKAEEGDAVAVGQVVCLIDTSVKAPKISVAKKEVKPVEAIKSLKSLRKLFQKIILLKDHHLQLLLKS